MGYQGLRDRVFCLSVVTQPSGEMYACTQILPTRMSSCGKGQQPSVFLSCSFTSPDREGEGHRSYISGSGTFRWSSNPASATHKPCHPKRFSAIPEPAKWGPQQGDGPHVLRAFASPGTSTLGNPVVAVLGKLFFHVQSK